MMRKRYLDSIKAMLEKFDISPAEKADILEDYRSMYEDAESAGLSEEEIIQKLGRAEDIYQGLLHEYDLKERKNKGDKLIALMPFIALMIFFGLGFGYDLWHPGWLAFLLIPSTAILVHSYQRPGRFIFTPMMPFLITVIYIVIGFFFNLWHPGWIIFLLIPSVAILESSSKSDYKSSLVGLSVFVGFMAFILIGYVTGMYHPTWLLLLLPIFVSSVAGNNKQYNFMMLISIFVSVGLYLYLGLNALLSWGEALIAFLPFIIVGVFTNRIMIHIGFGKTGKHGNFLKSLFLLSLIAFITLGYFYDAWAISWLFFLSVPIASMLIQEDTIKVTPMMPFISLIIFMVLGYFFGLWSIAWLAFLLIPMSAILEN